MKAIILVRISTKEQEDGHSIAAQTQRLKDYCLRRDFEIIRMFEIVESSTRGERKEFNAMLEFAKQQKEVVAIVSDAVDRVQRSFKESVLLDELIRKEVIELHFYRENMIIGKNASSSDIMRWDFSVMGAKSYVLQLSENVKRSLEWKIRNGECIGSAPPGYLNAKDALTGKSTVVIDPERGQLIKKLYEEYATGTYTLGELTQKAKLWGLRSRTKNAKPFSKSNIHKILQNPFYYGEMLVKGKLYRHAYTPLVTRQIFDHCQQVRLGWNKKPFQYSGKDFVFRGLIQCATTGQTVYTDSKKGGQYHYLVATHPADPTKKIWVKEEDVINQIKDVFKQFAMPEDWLKAIDEHLKGGLESERRFHREIVANLQAEEQKLTDKIDTLTDLLIERKISQEDYGRKHAQLTKQRQEALDQIKVHKLGDDSFANSLLMTIALLSKAYHYFEISSNERKRELINFVFSNLILNGGNLEYAMRSPFHHFTNLTTRSEWLRKNPLGYFYLIIPRKLQSNLFCPRHISLTSRKMASSNN